MSTGAGMIDAQVMQRLAVEEAAERANGLTSRSQPVGTTERRRGWMATGVAGCCTTSVGAGAIRGLESAGVSAILTDASDRAGSNTPGTAAARAAEARPRITKDRNRADITRPASVAGG